MWICNNKIFYKNKKLKSSVCVCVYTIVRRRVYAGTSAVCSSIVEAPETELEKHIIAMENRSFSV